MIFFYSSICIHILVTITVAASPLEGILTGPQELFLKNGQHFSGHALHITGDKLIFQKSIGDGTVQFTFALEDVEHLKLSGMQGYDMAGTSEPGQALPILQELYDHRRPWLSVLKQNEIARFKRLVELHLKQGNALRAATIATELLLHLEDFTSERELTEALALASHRMGLHDETESALARLMADTRRYGPSAFAHYLIGLRALENGQHALALDAALEPIVFSSQFPMDYLPHCYALAIVASLELDNPDHATELAEAMHARHLHMPAHPELAAASAFMDSIHNPQLP